MRYDCHRCYCRGFCTDNQIIAARGECLRGIEDRDRAARASRTRARAVKSVKGGKAS